MAPRTLLLLIGCQLVLGFNEPFNIVSHLNDDWFLFSDSRSDCNYVENNGHPKLDWLDLDPKLCNSGKISAKSGNSLFRSFHFTDFYNYTGEGAQIKELILVPAMALNAWPMEIIKDGWAIKLDFMPECMRRWPNIGAYRLLMCLMPMEVMQSPPPFAKPTL